MGSRPFWAAGALVVLCGCPNLPFPLPGGNLTFTARRTGCSEVSRSVSLSAVSNQAGASFQWFFPDGVTLSGQNVVHTFADEGPFDVTLVSGGQTITRRITVPVAGVADGGPDPFGDRCVPHEGDTHVPEGTTVSYRTNPPASGPHYSAAGVAPIAGGFYPTAVRPEVWVHNLEHGYVVILFDCPGACDQGLLDQLQALSDSLPVSRRFGTRKNVITRYAGLPVPFMCVGWDVQRDFNTLDTNGIRAFYDRRVDAGPEDLP
jgi:hypothetical protein